jgi:hypothetical protein
VINPKLKLTYIIVIILAASVLSLHTNTLYAMQGNSSKQSATGNNHASSETPSALHLLPYNDTNNNSSNNPPSKVSLGSSNPGEGGGSDTSTHDGSDSRIDHKHDHIDDSDGVDSNSDSNSNGNSHNHNISHKSHNHENKSKHRLKVGDIPFP